MSLISICFAINVYAFDTLAKVEMRTSYKKFEKCMQDAQNDITECVNEFNRTVDVYKKALKEEPRNEKIKQKLLTLVNALYDIAETYYSAAQSKKGVDPDISIKYFSKAAICYDQLIKLYPDKMEFRDISKQAKYLAAYEDVKVYLLELANRERLDYALLTLHKLKSSRASFNSEFGQSEDLDKDIDEVVGQFADNVNEKFKTELENQGADGVQTLVDLADAQAQIISVDPKEKYKTTFAQMETGIIRLINDLIKSYYADLKKSNICFEKGEYVQAEQSFGFLLERTESFPSYSSSNSSLQSRIGKSTNNFNLGNLQSEIQHKRQVAKNTANFLSIVENGKKAFSRKEWIVSYNAFNTAIEFAKENELAVKKDIPSDWLIKVQKKIANLDDDEIINRELADLHYKPLFYGEWLRLAKKGEFSKKFVSVSGKFQQKVGDVIILKDDTAEYDFVLETVVRGEQMNSAGIILKKNRLLQEGDFISCIAQFNDIMKFETVMGSELQLPVFNVIWSPE